MELSDTLHTDFEHGSYEADRDEILKTLTVPRLIEEGNSTSEFLNYVTCLGVVEEHKPTFIDHKPVKGVGTCPVAFWDLTGAAQ